MTSFILYVWVTTYAATMNRPIRSDYVKSVTSSWAYFGEFRSEEMCKEAGRQLGYKEDQIRCVKNK